MGGITMNEDLIKLLNEYKETEEGINLGIEWIKNKDYAQGKLDLIKTIIADLEKLTKEN